MCCHIFQPDISVTSVQGNPLVQKEFETGPGMHAEPIFGFRFDGRPFPWSEIPPMIDFLKPHINACAPVTNFVVEELAVGGIAVVKLDQEAHVAVAQSGFAHFKAGFHADIKGSRMLFFPHDVETRHGTEEGGGVPSAQFGPRMEVPAFQRGGVPGHQEFTARVHPEEGIFQSENVFKRFVAIVQSGDGVVEEKFIAQVGTLVIVLKSSGEIVPPVGRRQAKRKIGVEEVFGWRAPIELREHAGQKAQLCLERFPIPP